MTAFVANAPATSPTSGEPFTNDGWFPDIDQGKLRDAIRIDGDVTEERLKASAIAAMASINRELWDWQVQQIEAGYNTLEAVPGSELGGESRYKQLYLRAIYSTVKADLTERYRAYDNTGEGHRRADDLTPSIDEQRRNARWAVHEILGIGHTVVELI